jgi:hypothetical protein
VDAMGNTGGHLIRLIRLGVYEQILQRSSQRVSKSFKVLEKATMIAPFLNCLKS